MEPLATIVRYYDGCSAGDVQGMLATLDPDVVHWFLAPNVGSAPVRGADHLARYWRKVARMIEARWVVDHALTGDGEAVVEWTMWWRPEGATERVATRGAEWFALAPDGRIREIRSYYQQRPTTTELDGFPYAERGWSVPGAERSEIHDTERSEIHDTERSEIHDTERSEIHDTERSEIHDTERSEIHDTERSVIHAPGE